MPRLCLLAILLCLTSCSRDGGQEFVFNEGEVFGTVYHLTYASPGGKDFHGEIRLLMDGFSRSLSIYDLESVISRINRNDPDVETDKHFETCFQAAQKIARETDGAFDITVGALVNAWGFGFKNREEVTPERVEELLRRTGYEKVSLVEGVVRKEIPEIELDSNAIAKGFAVDVVAEFLSEKGCEDFMVEIGGELSVRGSNPKGRLWSIGIDKPVEELSFQGRELQTVVRIRDAAMATSGNYRNYYVRDGKKFAHTIDPKTGYPVQHSLLSASVIAPDCMTADAYATAFMVTGREKAIELVESNPALEALLIYSEGEGPHRIWASAGFGD